MRKIVILGILLAVISMVGCATLGLDPNATPTERQAALCRDAQLSYTLSVVMLEAALPGGTGMSDPAKAYWAAYKAGAELAIKTYCVN